MSLPNKSLKAIAQSQKKKHQLIFAAMAFTVVSLIFSFFFGDMGLFNFSKMKAASAQARQEVALLEIENQQLLHEIQLLKTDPFYVEAIARERLGLVKKGEIVYELYGAPATRGITALVGAVKKNSEFP